MKFGLFSIGYAACTHGETLANVARAAEQAGFESLWTGERVVAPDPQVPPSPAPADFPVLDPVLALAHAAAHTRKVKLGTGIIILPQRNPLVLAKEIASLDRLSNGRMIFGIGSGYLRPEFEALNVEFEHRAKRTEEYLRAMLAIWTMGKPEFRGRYFSFAGVNTAPRPMQRPHPPIVVGGHSALSLKLAAQLAQGWHGFALDLERTAALIDELREYRRSLAPGADDLEVSVTPPAAASLDTVRRYAELGVDRVILVPPTGSESDFLGFIERVERELMRRA